MKTHIYEDPSGVMLQVRYDPTTVPWTLEGIRVMDANYKVCGPDLAMLFDELFRLDPVVGIGEPYVNFITKDIRDGS